MKAQIELYNDIIHKVKIFYKALRLGKQEKQRGRKLAIPIPEIIALSLFQKQTGISTKQSIYDIFQPDCSYKTLVVNMNRFVLLALMILKLLLKVNRGRQHLVKHTDATDIPVCTNRKAKNHKTMASLASWGHTGKGWFFGLKLHLTADLNQQILALRFTSGNTADSKAFLVLNQNLEGIFIADAAYVSEKLAREFHREGERILLSKPRKNMRKLASKWQTILYHTRMLVELNFRSLKCFYGLITSFPRSVDGYLANYIYSLLAYCLS